ncbi:MAG: type II toxin-antitoxin system VapC family toxin [Selenomonadaceae bacterium]|nr:type II toxin-antitoxin system VapC family toxin [Selenomonadaceae bacterium]
MYLLDTHALIWFLSDSSELSPRTREIICSVEDVFVSYISLWEMAIKKSLGKLKLSYNFRHIIEICQEEHFQMLNINYKDLDKLEELPFFHRDPFDRLLIAQAQSRNLCIITKDRLIPQYDVNTLW